jgi:hypothetical protein
MSQQRQIHAVILDLGGALTAPVPDSSQACLAPNRIEAASFSRTRAWDMA